MNRVLTPDLMHETYKKAHQRILLSDSDIAEKVKLSNALWVEALKHCDILGDEYTQMLYDLGFPDDGKKTMLTLQEILDVCDKGIRWKGPTDNGVEIDMSVRLTHNVEPDGYSTYRFIGTYDGNDYAGVGCSAPCALESLFRLLERDMGLGCLTFETK